MALIAPQEASSTETGCSQRRCTDQLKSVPKSPLALSLPYVNPFNGGRPTRITLKVFGELLIQEWMTNGYVLLMKSLEAHYRAQNVKVTHYLQLSDVYGTAGTLTL